MKSIFTLIVTVTIIIIFCTVTFLNNLSDKLYNFSHPNIILPVPNIRSRCNCTPKTNIVFLKTHKCASSTVQNIFMRFGERHQLNLVLPADGNYFGHPQPFQRHMPLPLRNGTFNLFCHHTRFNRSEIESIMPEDTMYVTILRDPVSLFESLFVYFDLDKHWKLRLDQVPWMATVNMTRFNGQFGRNQMSFDLGLDQNEFDSPVAIRQFIDEMERSFDFVMLAERFDESLVLLKDILCWQLEDVIYFRQNARMDKLRQTITQNVSDEIRELNSADEQLYLHFSKIFESRVQRYGNERLAAQVAELRHWNKKWHEYCVEKVAVTKEDVAPQYRTWSTKVLGFHLRNGVNSHLCESMAKSEISFTTELRRRHKRKHSAFIFSFLDYLIENIIGY